MSARRGRSGLQAAYMAAQAEAKEQVARDMQEAVRVPVPAIPLNLSPSKLRRNRLVKRKYQLSTRRALSVHPRWASPHTMRSTTQTAR